MTLAACSVHATVGLEAPIGLTWGGALHLSAARAAAAAAGGRGAPRALARCHAAVDTALVAAPPEARLLRGAALPALWGDRYGPALEALGTFLARAAERERQEFGPSPAPAADFFAEPVGPGAWLRLLGGAPEAGAAASLPEGLGLLRPGAAAAALAEGLIVRLDTLRSSKQKVLPNVELVGHTAPYWAVLACTLEFRHIYSPATVVIAWVFVIVCFTAHLLMALRFLDLAWPDGHHLTEMADRPGKEWWPRQWSVPSAFSKAMWLLAPPRKLEPGQDCLLHEMADLSNIGGGVRCRKRKDANVPKKAQLSRSREVTKEDLLNLDSAIASKMGKLKKQLEKDGVMDEEQRKKFFDEQRKWEPVHRKLNPNNGLEAIIGNGDGSLGPKMPKKEIDVTLHDVSSLVQELAEADVRFSGRRSRDPELDAAGQYISGSLFHAQAGGRRPPDLPWQLTRVAISTSVIVWLYMIIVSVCESIMGPESLMKPPGEPPWIRDTKRRHYTQGWVHTSKSETYPTDYKLWSASTASYGHESEDGHGHRRLGGLNETQGLETAYSALLEVLPRLGELVDAAGGRAISVPMPLEADAATGHRAHGVRAPAAPVMGASFMAPEPRVRDVRWRGWPGEQEHEVRRETRQQTRRRRQPRMSWLEEVQGRTATPLRQETRWLMPRALSSFGRGQGAADSLELEVRGMKRTGATVVIEEKGPDGDLEGARQATGSTEARPFSVGKAADVRGGTLTGRAAGAARRRASPGRASQEAAFRLWPRAALLSGARGHWSILEHLEVKPVEKTISEQNKRLDDDESRLRRAVGMARTGQPLAPMSVAFNPDTLDLEADVLGQIAEEILDSELPHLCEVRPHEDPLVEAWLQRWVDGEDAGADRLQLQSSCLVPLLTLAMERPEVCPNFCGQLSEFEHALEGWLRAWPPAEPPRRAGPGAGGPSAEALELELHGVLALLRGEVYSLALLEEGRPPEMRQPPVALGGEPADSFRGVAMGWVLKLDLLYGKPVLQQPERMAAAVGPRAQHGLSLLRWDVDQMEQLLSCAFFRPDEDHLWELAQQWLQENGGGEEAEARLSRALAPHLLDGAAAAGAEEAEEEPLFEATLVRAPSFGAVARHGSCTTAAFGDHSALHREQLEGVPWLRWRNAAREDQILGASRQLLASDVLMSPASGGIFRLELRMLSGSDAEAAHLFEVGVAVERKAGQAGVVFGPGGARAPPRGALDSPAGDEAPVFFNLFDARDILLEGVRLVIEVDVGAGCARVRNVPSVLEDDDRHASLVAWLQARSRVAAKDVRPAGEVDCHMFREHARHLQELANQGKLDRGLASMVHGDAGVQAVHATNSDFLASESYCFYVVVPAGVEVEIF
ncbi:unnamed protein product [Prorocentrum cordatum]|uniref:Uncharacterized protein n=1 Tax=Prorocentrum cordatum TaxID=2364126 RepID=A0ABN9UL86_9DINO|nr:unnamed protein product [Polarella glacialis]